jgi:membrane associated rhomboid family serine protease
MARGYSDGPSIGFPRPGRALTGVLIGLFAIWLFFALGINWGGSFASLFKTLSGNTALILQGEIWRLFTAAFLHAPSGTVWHIVFALLMLYMFGAQLEQEWGPKRFLKFLMGSAVFAYSFQVLVVIALPESIESSLVPPFWFGSAPVISAVTIAWALTFRGRTINLMFVVPVTSRGLIVFVILIDVMYLVAQARVPEGLISPFGGMLAGWLFGASGPSPLRRVWLKLRLAQLDAEARREADARKKRVARSGLQVLEGGRGQDSDNDVKKPPGGWLN